MTNRLRRWCFALLPLLVAPVWAADDIFATVDGERISAQEYRMAVQSGIKRRFYHGKIPEDQLRKYREEVGQQLVDRVLLLKEAKRRHLRADERSVETRLKAYQAGVAKSSKHTDNAELLAGLKQFFAEEDLLRQLEETVKTVGVADESALLTYYRQHPDLFTTPERVRASIILLKVDPSSGAPAWNAANSEAQKILAKLNKGASFTELARLHSGDDSAKNGGDLGYVHAGMLAEPAQQALAKLKPGQISEAVLLLQGVAIFRLEERVAPKLNEFAAVATRVGDLWRRERAQNAWRGLVDSLRKQAEIHIKTELYRES